MTNEEINTKIKEIQIEFKAKIQALIKERSERITNVKRSIDQRTIDALKKGLNI